MDARKFRTVLIACAVILLCGVAFQNANGQIVPGIRRGVVPVPVQPAPPPAQAPEPLQVPPGNAALPGPPPAPGESGPMEASPPPNGETGQLIRGRELIGMPIWGSNDERLGLVKDFIVDYQAGCPSLFFAMAPEISGWSGDYVIVPFDAFQFGYDRQHRIGHFRLGVPVDSLRRAPHVQINRWNSLNDRQLFTDARQFYRPFERTAARPDVGIRRDGREGEGREGWQPSDRGREAPAAPPNQPRQPPSGKNVVPHRESEANPRPRRRPMCRVNGHTGRMSLLSASRVLALIRNPRRRSLRRGLRRLRLRRPRDQDPPPKDGNRSVGSRKARATDHGRTEGTTKAKGPG